MRKNAFFLMLVSVFLFSCISPAIGGTAVPTSSPVPTLTPTPIVEPPRSTVSYVASEDNILNPERGFAVSVDLEDSDYSGYYDDGNTLVYMTIRLDDYRDTDIPVSFLQDMDRWFSNIREAGIKAIVRFAYNDGPYPNSEPDASLDQILRHIDQVKPVIAKNEDVIAWLEAGFIGAWGEWHTSTHGLDRDPEAKQTVLFALLDAVPPDRMVSLRYPVDIMNIFPEPLSAENAYTETYQARVGFHNDCLLSSNNDQHTYARGGVHTVEEEYAYLSQMTQFVPVGGESCEYYPPRSDCETALKELSMFHFTEVSDEWYPDVLDAWDEQGCYDVFQQRLGYRLSLETMTANNLVLPGGILNVRVSLRNSGFSSLKNPRPVYLVLDGPRRYEVLLPIDPRRWAPGQVSSFSVRLRVPAQAPNGAYQFALWLPDFYTSLQTDSRYSVRFANEDVWNDREGYNVLGTVEVDSRTSGATDPTAEELMVIP